MAEVEDSPPRDRPHYWHSRGYLPHYDEPGLFQMLTFRLHDALPAHKMAELNRGANRLTPGQVRGALEGYLDAGCGACYLRDPRIAAIAQQTLLHFDEERYNLLAWVVMPNHMHVLAQLRRAYPLSKVLQSWKGYIANQSNKVLGRHGTFWQHEYYDRYIRNADHYRNAIAYIEGNPVKARLVDAPEKWPYSSAALKNIVEQSQPLSGTLSE
jgi:putative transposase